MVQINEFEFEYHYSIRKMVKCSDGGGYVDGNSSGWDGGDNSGLDDDDDNDDDDDSDGSDNDNDNNKNGNDKDYTLEWLRLVGML